MIITYRKKKFFSYHLILDKAEISLIMLVSNPPVNSHPLTNNLTSSNNFHSSLPSSLTPLTKRNPCLWSIKEVEEWLIKHDLNDCIDLICFQHRMTGQRLMNLKEDDILQLKGIKKKNELWLQIKKLQQYYSSNYCLLTQQSSTFQQQQQQQQQSLPLTNSSYFPPSPLQAPIPLRLIQPSTQVRPTSPSVKLVTPPSILLTQSQASLSSSSSSHTSVQINQNQQQNPPISSSANQNQSSTSTTILLERSPLTTTNSTKYHRRSSSHSLTTSSTSINILPPSSSAQRTTNTLLHPYGTPADQIEDQPIVSCCCVGSLRSDRKKTLSACLLALTTVYFCSFIITIVDERLPDPNTFKPLPDLVLDNIKQIPWAFSVTEKIIVIEVVTLITIVALHRHR